MKDKDEYNVNQDSKHKEDPLGLAGEIFFNAKIIKFLKEEKYFYVYKAESLINENKLFEIRILKKDFKIEKTEIKWKEYWFLIDTLKPQELEENNSLETSKRDWKKALQLNTIEGYRSFINLHPNSEYVQFAKNKIKGLQEQEERDWKNAKNTNTIQAYQSFINSHPNSEYVQIAKNKIKGLKEQKEKDWKNAKNTNTIQAYQSFIESHPDSEYFHQASRKLNEIKQEKRKKLFTILTISIVVLLLIGFAAIEINQILHDLEYAKRQNTVDAYNDFMNKHTITGLVLNIEGIIEKLDWKNAQNINTVEAYEKYLFNYPDGLYASEAKENIEELNWQKAQNTNTVEAYEKYLENYPQGKHALDAKDNIEKLDWKKAHNSNTVEAYKKYLDKYPQGIYASKAKDNIEELDWEKAYNSNTVQSYEDYLKKYPQGIYASKAKEKIDNHYWKIAENSGDIEDYKTYLHKCKLYKLTGNYVEEARDAIDVLGEKTLEIENNYGYSGKIYLTLQKRLNTNYYKTESKDIYYSDITFQGKLVSLRVDKQNTGRYIFTNKEVPFTQENGTIHAEILPDYKKIDIKADIGDEISNLLKYKNSLRVKLEGIKKLITLKRQETDGVYSKDYAAKIPFDKDKIPFSITSKIHCIDFVYFRGNKGSFEESEYDNFVFESTLTSQSFYLDKSVPITIFFLFNDNIKYDSEPFQIFNKVKDFYNFLTNQGYNDVSIECFDFNGYPIDVTNDTSYTFGEKIRSKNQTVLAETITKNNLSLDNNDYLIVVLAQKNFGIENDIKNIYLKDFKNKRVLSAGELKDYKQRLSECFKKSRRDHE